MDAKDDKVDEEGTFHAAMRGVRRRAESSRQLPYRTRPSARPKSREADDLEVLAELRDAPLDHETLESGDTLIYRAPGLQDSVWRRLRRGHYRVGPELDLHGLNRDRARIEVQRFLADCHHHNRRCVRIIHGKGHGSPNTGPVIKSLLDSWLRRRHDVLAFCSARPQDGGTGAVYVLLRAAERPAQPQGTPE